MLIELKTAETESDFILLADLAREIWLEHYDGIVGLDQIEYMLGTLQSPAAIAQQVADGCCYSIVLLDTEPAGYLAYQLDTQKKQVFLSKFYVAAPYRRKGAGRHMLKDVENHAARNGCKKIWLTVNRNNTDTITAYEKLGFLKKGELETEIGKGYIMDDYMMVKVIPFCTTL